MSTRVKEPVLNVAAVTGAATAIIALLVAFWPGLLDESQKVAILGIVGVAAPFLVAAIARGKVAPNSSVVERRAGDVIVAGPANERVSEGTVVREVEAIPRRGIPTS